MADSKKQLSWKRIVKNQPVYDKISHTLNWAMKKNQFLATLKLSLCLFPRDEKLAEPGFEPGSQEMVFWSFLWSHVSFYFIRNQNLFFTQSQKKFVFFSTRSLSLSSTGKPQRRTFAFFCHSLSLSLSLLCALSFRWDGVDKIHNLSIHWNMKSNFVANHRYRIRVPKGLC